MTLSSWCLDEAFGSVKGSDSPAHCRVLLPSPSSSLRLAGAGKQCQQQRGSERGGGLWVQMLLPRESDELGILLGDDGNHSPTRPSTIIPQGTPDPTRQADLPNPCCWHRGPLPTSSSLPYNPFTSSSPMSVHACSSEPPFFPHEPHSRILACLHHQDGDL